MIGSKLKDRESGAPRFRPAEHVFCPLCGETLGRTLHGVKSHLRAGHKLSSEQQESPLRALGMWVDRSLGSKSIVPGSKRTFSGS
jgi:hypothetical protein